MSADTTISRRYVQKFTAVRLFRKAGALPYPANITHAASPMLDDTASPHKLIVVPF
jgi:hypothetical protein